MSATLVKKNGRPRYPWNDRLENIILARISNGESLVSICKRKRFPSYFSVMKRLHESEKFEKRYAYARELQAERMAEEILEIADDGRNDKMKDEDGRMIIDFDHINRSRLRVDSRKWVAAKLLPKKFGDQPNKTEVNVTNQTVVISAQEMQQLQDRRRKVLEDLEVKPSPPSE